MKATIIGGGIGGVTLAVALGKAGVEAHVYERAPYLREVGAGISLWANALGALDVLGLGNSIRARMRVHARSEIRTSGGAVLSGDGSAPATGSLTVGVLHRAELLEILVGSADPSRLHLNSACIGFTQDPSGVTAQFANGSTARGDVLIGADGLHSVIRAGLFGATPPRYAGYTAWRGVANFPSSPPTTCETWGGGRRFGAVPMNGGRVYWYATANSPAGERDAPGQTKQNLLRMFRGWHDPIEPLLDATDEASILRNDICDRDPLSCWTKGRVTLLGDAAHPMTPNLGQGACQAIEDAVVLAVCLSTSADIDSGLRNYQTRRIPRTRGIVMTSRRIGDMSQWENRLLCFIRNSLLRAVPASVARRQLTGVVNYNAVAERESLLFADPPHFS